MSEMNEALIRRWFDAVWNEKDTDTIYELLAPEGISHVAESEIVGPAAFHEYHTRWITAFPDLRVTIDEVITQGKSGAIRWTVTGTHTGAGLGLDPSDKKVNIEGMTWVHIRDGKIVEGWDKWDLGGLFQKLSAQ